MNTRVSPGPKHEPPVEVSFSVTPWASISSSVILFQRKANGDSRDTPFPDARHLTGTPDPRSRLQFRARFAVVAPVLAGVGALGFGGLLAWHVASSFRGGGFRSEVGLEADLVVRVLLIVLVVLTLAAAAALLVPVLHFLRGKKLPQRRIWLVFGGEAYKTLRYHHCSYTRMGNFNRALSV